MNTFRGDCMSEKRFIPYCVNTDDCLVCKYVQKHYDDEVVGFTGADCLKGHSIYPQTCEDFEIKFYWKIIRKLKGVLGVTKMSDKRFIALGSTHIKDTLTGEEFYAPSEDELLDLLNEQQDLIEVLYDFRLVYNALLFNEWAENQKYEVYKSRRHGDGELCFDGEYFIVVAQLPTGQVTNHYHIKHWDMFKINEYEKVKEEFDGHTPSDVMERLQQVIDV